MAENQDRAAEHGEAGPDTARLLGVSDDTVRRWVDAGTLPVETDAANRKVVDGAALAAFARKHANAAPDPSDVGRSARNRLVGLVTEVITDPRINSLHRERRLAPRSTCVAFSERAT